MRYLIIDKSVRLDWIHLVRDLPFFHFGSNRCLPMNTEPRVVNLGGMCPIKLALEFGPGPYISVNPDNVKPIKQVDPEL